MKATKISLLLAVRLQVCQEAARRPMWQLRDGRMVPLEEGCFLQADLAQIGAAAMAFIQRRLPLFNVPWRVQLALDAAGVPGCKTVTPESIRSAFRHPDHPHADHNRNLTCKGLIIEVVGPCTARGEATLSGC